MFERNIYLERRRKLKELVRSGILLFLGNTVSPMNYSSNPYRFRQDSSFLYFFGIDEPNLMAVINIDEDEEIIFGDELTIDDVIWMGELPTLKEKADSVGVSKVFPLKDLKSYIEKHKNRVHYLPPYRAESKIFISELLDIPVSNVKENASEEFIKAVVKLREKKSTEEIEEIEKAINITAEMHITAMKLTKPGIYEREIAGLIEGIALSKGSGVSFPVIFSVHGEILHNHSHENLMQEGRLVVNDSGAESLLHYAGDITRTFPVGKKFTQKQKDIYEIVLSAQLKAIKMLKPGIKYKDVHIEASKVIADGLRSLGILKGSTNDIVENGAHALFFPHGLGHMLGLDVHDMENLGEDYVGYREGLERSSQFGLAYLRLAKELEPGFVLTVEPGIYFIPKLIELWEAEGKFKEYINYSRVKEYLDFGGIRIEDDCLITETSSKVLGRPIPKTVQEIEDLRS